MTGPLLASRVMKARRQSTCPICRGPIRVGDSIAKTVKWAHTGCVIASRYYGSTPNDGDHDDGDHDGEDFGPWRD
jgi:hypothetical protein